MRAENQSALARAESFAPVETPDAKVLILGSMPGKTSLREQEYYAHPQNAFWRIQGELIGAHAHLPYGERLQILKDTGIALWDVLQSCVRPTSLDADIDDSTIVANDFDAFLLTHKQVRHIFFNGTKAEQCFRKFVLAPLHKHPEHLSLLTTHAITYHRLPSTSPAHAGMPYLKKLEAWRLVTECSGRFVRQA